MNYLAFNYEITGSDHSDQLVALLSDEGFEGFEETGNLLKAFVPEATFNHAAFDTIRKLFPSLVYTKTVVENINWNKQWEQSFEPVRVNNFAAIRADFHASIANVQHEIIVTPKMSFGTGHHATTFLMVQQMESLDFKDKTVLDFGTGTGILAILAEKLGAAKILAIDNDEWSITNAIENARQNGCNKIIIEQHNVVPVVKKYDIILANINLNVITANLAAIRSVSGTGCKILLSGFLKENEGVMQDAIRKTGFNFMSTIQRAEWIAITAVK